MYELKKTMKEYNITVTEKFIKQAHKDACKDWKIRIEDLVPQAFEEDTLNKWTIYKDSIVFNIGEQLNNYGIAAGEWKKGLSPYSRIATREEIREALIEEAKRRGLVVGAKYDSLYFEGFCCKKNTEIKSHLFNKKRNILYTTEGVLFHNGEWATPIDDLILERIKKLEKELEQLKSEI